jgi:hypothetical protein
MTTDTTPREIEFERRSEPIAAEPPSEFLMGLNGFDEIAVAARFGDKIATLRNDPIALGRALAFVHYRRHGLNDADAHEAALTLSIRAVVEFFPPEAEPEPVDDPASAEGNAQSST